MNWKKAFSLILLSAFPWSGYANCPGPETWSGATSGTWNDATNWNPNTCVPGSVSTNTDSATFGSTVGAGPAISLDAVAIQPGLGQLIFNNGTTSFTILGTGGNFIQFNGASSSIQVLAGSHTIDAPVQLISTLLTVSVNSGGTLNFVNKSLSESVTSAINFSGPGQWQNNLGTMSLQGDFMVSGGTFVNNSTTIPTAGGTNTTLFAQNILINPGSTILNQNTAANNGLSVGSFLQSIVNTSISGGSLINTNSGALNVALATGGFVQIDGALNLTSGSFINSNSGPISNVAQGVLVDIELNANISGGSVVNSNSGPITAAGIGSYFDADTNLVMTGGSITNTNSGSVDATSIGALLVAVTQLTMTGGSITNTNSGTVAAGGKGALIQTPQITISGGSLTNNDFVQANTISIQSSGVLAGSGIIQDNSGGSTAQVSNSGTVIAGSSSPGSPTPGTMNIQGSYTQSSTGTLVVNIESTSHFSQLSVTGTPGTAQVAGTLVYAFSPQANFSLQNSFPIISAQNGLTGQFSNIINFNNPNVVAIVQLIGNQLFLSFAPVLLPTDIQLVMPFILNSNANFNLVLLDEKLFDLYQRIDYRLSQATQEAIPSKLKKEHEGKKRRKLFSSESLIHKLEDRPSHLLASNLDQPAFLSPNETLVVAKEVQEKQEELKRKIEETPPEGNPSHFYFGPHYKICNTGKIETHSAGAGLGYDYAFQGFGLGGLTNYQHTSGHGANINEANLTLYGTYVPKALRHLALDASVEGCYDWISIHRKTGFSNHLKSKGTTTGNQLITHFGIKYTLRKDQISFLPENLQMTPCALLKYKRCFFSKYRTHGAGSFNLKIEGLQTKFLSTELGTRIYYKWDASSNIRVEHDFYLGWQREYFRDHVKLRERSFISGQPLTKTRGKRIAANGLEAAVDCMVLFFKKYGIEFTYNLEWNHTYHSNNFGLLGNYYF